MLTPDDIVTWKKHPPMEEEELVREALTLSWMHWDEIANLTLHQFAGLSDPYQLHTATFGGKTCACCRAFNCTSKYATAPGCPLDLTGPYTGEQSQCCGGCWRMFHKAMGEWAEAGKPIKGQWHAILKTAAEDVREFIGLVMKGEA